MAQAYVHLSMQVLVLFIFLLFRSFRVSLKLNAETIGTQVKLIRVCNIIRVYHTKLNKSFRRHAAINIHVIHIHVHVIHIHVHVHVCTDFACTVEPLHNSHPQAKNHLRSKSMDLSCSLCIGLGTRWLLIMRWLLDRVMLY